MRADHAVDYLLKLIKISRLQTALSRVQEKNLEESSVICPHFKVFNRNRMIGIPWQQARYLLAEHNTVFLFTGDGECYELPKTLVFWEESLGDKIIRLHRNTLVFRHTLDSLVRMDDTNDDEGNASWAAKVLDIENLLPVSRRQLSAIRRILRDN